jgi:hypothetical protein
MQTTGNGGGGAAEAAAVKAATAIANAAKAKAAAAKATAAKAAASKSAAAKAKGGKSTGGGSSSGAASGGAATSSASTSGAGYDNSAAGKAASFGWSLAVINSNPELKDLFAQATATGPNGGWTTDHFVAKVRDTHWFKTTSDTARQATILQKADPATYNARVSAAAAQANTMASTIGAPQTPAQLALIGTHSVMFGWNSDQLRQAITGSMTAHGGTGYTGEAAASQYQYTQLANQYGVDVAPATMGNWVVQTARGNYTADMVKNNLIASASSRYPSLAERLKSGETVQQIADPYIQSQAKILELNPNNISLMDKSIQSALASKDPKTGQAVTQPVWDYEQTLRNDPRYMKTQQAQDASMNMAHTVLQDWGVAS